MQDPLRIIAIVGIAAELVLACVCVSRSAHLPIEWQCTGALCGAVFIGSAVIATAVLGAARDD